MASMRRVAILLTLIIATACARGGPVSSRVANSDSTDIRKAIEAGLLPPAGVSLVLGFVKFVPQEIRKPDPARDEDVTTEWPLYRAYADKGFIEIVSDRDLANGITLPLVELPLVRTGVQRTAWVLPTEKGHRAGQVVRQGRAASILLPVGTPKVGQIASTEEVVVGDDLYEVVEGTHTNEVPQDLKAAYAEARRPAIPTERRFRALLKYDADQRSWRYIGADIGPPGRAFWTRKVDQSVAALRSCGTVAGC